MNSKTKLILFLSFASMFVLGIADNIRGPLFPEIIQTFSLSGFSSSFFYASTSFAAFVASMASLRFLKRMSLSQLLLLSLVCMTLSMVGIGYAPNYVVLILSAVLLGLSIGGLGVSQNLLVSENVPLDFRAKALSGLHSIYGLSSLIAPVFAFKIANSFSGWTSAFFAAGLVCLVLVLFMFFMPKRLQSHPEQFTKSQDPQKNESNSVTAFSWAKLMISGLFAFYVVAEILVSTRLALYMRENFGMDLNQSSLYVTYFFIFLFLGRLLFAFVKIPGTTRMQMNLSLGLSLIFLILGLQFHPFFLALVGLSMAPYYPLSVAYISQSTGSNERAYLTFAMAMQSLSVVGMHIGAGYMTDSFGGVRAAFAIGVLALVLSALCLNFHPKIIHASR